MMKMVGHVTLYKLQITYYKPGWKPMTDVLPPTKSQRRKDGGGM